MTTTQECPDEPRTPGEEGATLTEVPSAPPVIDAEDPYRRRPYFI